MTTDKSTTRIVYISYDRFPSPKGAATHIDAFVRALGQAFAAVDLLTVGPDLPESAHSVSCDDTVFIASGVTHHPLPAIGNNLFERVLNFRAHMLAWWRGRRFPIVHVRSIFEGYPIACHKRELCDKLVYEVNGLPSIELKYHYPRVVDDRELLRKLEAQEQACLDAADLVITVSETNAAHLIGRGVDRRRLRVIPNGVDMDIFRYSPPRPLGDHPVRMLYAGTMSAWQGVYVAIEALALYRRDYPATLTLVGPARSWQRKEILNRAWELGVTEHVELLEPLAREELAALHHQADVIVAPLTPNDRNLVQGCCPLKVLEAMASGTPLIASDLPVVRELVEADVDALLVRPGSAKAIKDGMLRLRKEPGLAARLSSTARGHIAKTFAWSHAQNSLIQAYEEILEPMAQPF